jgi:hypothetical protein
MNDRSHDPRTRDEVDPEVAELMGLRSADADATADEAEVDAATEFTDTARDEGDLGPGPMDDIEALTTSEPRIGETDDPTVAAEEGLAWIPPVDPPVRPGEDGDPEVAAGFGTTSEDEPYDADHHGEVIAERDERTARVIEALAADAATTGLADQLLVDTDGSVVTISGTVEDLADEDAITAVAGRVTGVTDVVTHLTIRALDSADRRV